jgi:hypothetical protein
LCTSSSDFVQDCIGKKGKFANDFLRTSKPVDGRAVLCFHVSMKKKETNRPFCFGIGGLVLLNLLLFGDVLFGGGGRVLSNLPSDLSLLFAAWRQFAFEQLAQGHLALWNPHYLCGAPFLGGFEAGLLYPPNWLFLVLPLVFSLNFNMALHVFLAGAFTFLWAYHRGLKVLACFVSGAVFMFGGAFYLHLYAGHLSHLCTMVWAPLIFLCLDGFFQKPSLRWIAAGIFAVSMQVLAGHPQYLYFTAILAGLYAFLNIKGRRDKWNILGGVAAMIAGAGLLAAAQLWTGIQAFLECGRNMTLAYGSASSFSFPPQNLLTLILPEFFGNLRDAHYWSQWFLWEVSLFTGVTAFFLAVLGAIWGEPLKRRWAVTCAAVALVLSLGAYTPLFRFFYEWFPIFRGMRGICKFDFLVLLFLAILAGIGLDELMRRKKIPSWPVFATLITGLALSAAGLALFAGNRAGTSGIWFNWFTSVRWLRKSLVEMGGETGLNSPRVAELVLKAGVHAAFSLVIAGATFLLLSFLLKMTKTKPATAYAIAALSLFELFWFAAVNRPTFEYFRLEKKFQEIREQYAKDKGDYRVYGTGSASLAAGGYDIWVDQPMVLGRYGRFVCFSQGLAENQLFSVVPIFKTFSKVFGMVRLKYLINLDQEPIEIYRTPFKLLPRMLLVYDWEMKKDAAEILPALFEPAFDPIQRVYLEGEPGFTPPPPGLSGRVQWKDLNTEKIEIEVDTPRDALLLVTDNYSSGWKAVSLSGEKKRYHVVPANYFLRAVPLQAGRHHFLMEYRPRAFEIGKWVSLLSGLLYVGMLIIFLKQSFYKKRP